jgi:hypothetical protein
MHFVRTVPPPNTMAGPMSIEELHVELANERELPRRHFRCVSGIGPGGSRLSDVKTSFNSSPC